MCGILFRLMMVVLVNVADVRAEGISGDEDNNTIVMPLNEDHLKELIR